MRIFSYLCDKVGPLTLKYSNLPESYVKRAMEQVYYRTPSDFPQYAKKEIKRKHFRFTTNRPWTMPFFRQNNPGTMRKKVFVEPIAEWSFFVGDRVELQVGKDKGKHGIINQVIQERNWVLVEGLNAHHRVIFKEKNFPGMVISSEAPLLVTGEVKLVDPETLKATDIEWRYTEDGNKVRVSTETGRVIPMPKQSEVTYDYKTKGSYVENATKDTVTKVVSEVTYEPKLCTFEMDIMNEMDIKEDRIPVKSYWY